MVNHYTFSEQTDMLLVLGFCSGNYRESVRVYHERFPNRRIPCCKTFARIERRLREKGSLEGDKKNSGRTRNVRTVEVEENILHTVEDDPSTSSRLIAVQVGVSKSTVNRVTKEQLLYPYHVQRVQDLLPTDHEGRVRFCQIIRQKNQEDLNFTKKILFTDEAFFTRRGITNVHNEHVYADENPHAIKVKHFQHEFGINVWMGVINNLLVGPFELPNRLNSNEYLAFLRDHFQPLLEDVPYALRRDMYFMQDGAPPHFARAVRDYLHAQYPEKWIGRGQDAPIRWPPRSPDLTPCDFFLWGALAEKVYSVRIDTRQQLWARIQEAVNNVGNEETLQRVQFNFLRRLHLCIQENGAHFEHLM